MHGVSDIGVQQMIPNVGPGEITAIGAVLIITWKVLEVGKQMFLSKKNGGVPPMSALACQVDPQHFQRIRTVESEIKHLNSRWDNSAKEKIIDIHSHTETIDKQVAQGEFGCAWKDRDEIRDLLQGQASLAIEMRALATEIRKSRNNGN